MTVRLRQSKLEKKMNKEKYNVAVVGATGAVGEQMREVLEERQFPVGELRLLASERSAGQFLPFQGRQIRVQVLDDDSFEGIDIGLFSAGGSVSAKFAPGAVAAGAVVVDNTSVFRMEPDIPLVVPEVNSKEIGKYKNRGIIANPNCSTIQMVVALKPIHDAARIKRVVVSTYQSVSGAGRAAMEELSQQVAALFNGREILKEKFPHQIAFNCIPHIDGFLENGYTKEEWKMIQETRKILGEPDLPVTATTVRVPVFLCHSESLNVETRVKLSAAEAKQILREAPGIVVADEPENNIYPMAIEAAGRDAIYVGRVRSDESVANGLNLWVVADNLRKGAALNAVQIAEILIREYI
jgi:aspartate-semialdehyde dehydrogenase